MTYFNFLQSKRVTAPSVGFDVAESDLNAMLFPFQKYTVRWALRRGCAALFEECGLGKTAQQLEWAQQVHRHTNRDILILTPLAVAAQTALEAAKFGIEVTVCRSQDDVRAGINIANYERLHLFNADHFGGVVLDESSILKSYMGATKRSILEAFAATPFKLACTATPSPNDHMELGNHAEFLGIMPSNEMLARWFINDTTHFGRYRVKGHAAADFWRWVASWAMCVAKPSDIGFSDDGFDLPELQTLEHCIDVDQTENAEGRLFRLPDLSATGVHKEMRLTTAARVARAANLTQEEPHESWIVWCNTNYESEAIAALIPDATEIRGNHSPEQKERAFNGFVDGSVRVLVTKPSIAGFGLNWQHCARASFVGLSYSFEQYYQAVRRVWRFGQTREVHSHIAMASTESDIVRTVQGKQKSHLQMQDNMARAISEMHREDVSNRELRADAGDNTPQVPQWLRAA